MLTTPAADEDQKLLLYIDYVCTEKGVVLPWDSIAATMEPRDAAKGEKPMTGEAIKQHLAKLRDHREGLGHAVPPKLDRGARRAIIGKNTPSTPAPTPRKSSGSSGPPMTSKMFIFGRGKFQGAETETPVKKGSSLVAPVSKSKQKRAEKARREALLSSGSGGTIATNLASGKLSGGLKAITGKRGRRQAAAAAALAEEDEDRDDAASSGVIRGGQSRRPERKNHAGMGRNLEELGIKDEPDSEDDLPLSKRRNTGQTLGGRKKTAIGLMGDTVQMWQNRNGKSAVGESAAQSPEVQQSIEQVVGVPNNCNGNGNNQNGHAGLSQAFLGDLPSEGSFLSGGSHYQDNFHIPQATVGGNTKEMSIAFNPVNYQTHGMQGHLDQQLSGTFSNFYPQTETGHPSPMDYDIVEYQAYGRRDGAPGPIYVPRQSNNHTGQFSNDHPLTSSPAYDNMSSATCSGSDPSSARKNAFTNPSFSNTQGLQDPFTARNCNGYFAEMPAQDVPTLGNWGAQSNQTAAVASFDAEHQYPGYKDSQISSGYANPTLTMPASGLGLGIPQSHSDDNNFEPSTETNAGHAFPSNPYLDQPVTPAFGTAMGSSDLGDPHDPFLDMNDLFNGNFLAPLHGNDCDG